MLKLLNLKREEFLSLFFGSLFFRLLLILLAPLIFAIFKDGWSESWLSLYYNWDALKYLQISYQGYDVLEKGQHFLLVYLPLWPFLVFLFGSFLGNELAGLLIPLVISSFASVLLYALIKMDYSKKFAYYSFVMSIIFPTAFYFFLPYTESLFLFLSVFFFIFLRKEKFIWATIFLIFTSLTRITGILLIIPLVIKFWKKRKFKPKELAFLSVYILIGSLGIFAYFLLNKFYTGSFTAFLDIQAKMYTLKQFSFFSIPEQIWDNFMKLISWKAKNTNSIIVDIFESFFSFSALILLFWGRKILKLEYFAYALACLLILLGQNFWLSNTRYILVIFPLFVVVSSLLENLEKKYPLPGKNLTLIIAGMSVFLMGIFYIRYTFGLVTLL